LCPIKFPGIIACMTVLPFDRATLRAYIAEHGLTERAMAEHAGVPYRTLRGVLALNKEPRPATRTAIERALESPPPPRPLPRYGEDIARLWPGNSSVAIARLLHVSKQRVLQIVHEMGLPPHDRRTAAPHDEALK
jgi:hypothetical protein